jgi:hypothetical protein
MDADAIQLFVYECAISPCRGSLFAQVAEPSRRALVPLDLQAQDRIGAGPAVLSPNPVSAPHWVPVLARVSSVPASTCCVLL